jgi:hypothetical protein
VLDRAIDQILAAGTEGAGPEAGAPGPGPSGGDAGGARPPTDDTGSEAIRRARAHLEDNALVLLRQGETAPARRALAAAAALDPYNPTTAHLHPLFRTLAERALAVSAPPDGDEGEGGERPETAPGLAPLAEEEAGLRRRPSGLILPGG